MKPKELHENALMIYKTIFDEGHADVATSYNNLASVYNRLGEYNQAKGLHEKVLLICKKIFGEDHAAVATSYSVQPLRTIQSSQGTSRKSTDD